MMPDNELGKTRLIVIYITPSEETKLVVFCGFPLGHDPSDYAGQLAQLMPERSCCQPFSVQVWEHEYTPAIWCSKTGWLEPEIINLG